MAAPGEKRVEEEKECDDDVQSMTVPELRSFLSARNVPSSTIPKKADLVHAALATKSLDLPVQKSETDEALEIVITRASKLQVEQFLTLPDPDMLKLWEPAPYSLPDFTEQIMNEYFARCNESVGVETAGEKSLREGKSLHFSGHVISLHYHGISKNIQYAFVKAQVTPQTRVHEKPYDVWVVLHKETAEVSTAHCGCIAGLGGFCKHVAALLCEMAVAVAKGLNKACTSKEQQWHQPSKKDKSKHAADFIHNIPIRKITAQSNLLQTTDTKVGRHRYDPRAVADRKDKKLCDFDLESLARISNGSCGVLLYVPHTFLGNINDAEFEETVMSSQLPNTVSEAAQAALKMAQSGKDSFAKLFFKHLRCSSEEIMALERATCGQARNQIWHEHRKGRVTSSKAHMCAKKVGDSGAISGKTDYVVASVMDYADPFVSPATTWGSSREKQAITRYYKESNHRSLKVTPCGMFVDKELSFVAASPDSLVQCECHGKGILEVKNPWKYRDLTIDEYVSKSDTYLKSDSQGVYYLDKSHEYYTQVQLQMHVSNTKWCDFCVCLKNSFFVQNITYDETFTDVLLKKLFTMYHAIILPELESGEVEDKYITKSVSNVIKHLLNSVEANVEPSLSPSSVGCIPHPTLGSISMSQVNLSQSSVVSIPHPTLGSKSTSQVTLTPSPHSNVSSRSLSQVTLSPSALASTTNPTLGSSCTPHHHGSSISTSPAGPRSTDTANIVHAKGISVADTSASADEDVSATDNSCAVCMEECVDEPSTYNEKSIGCDICQGWFHWPCVGIRGTESFLRYKKMKWYCPQCEVSAPPKKRKK